MNKSSSGPTAEQLNTPAQRARRKIAREEFRLWDEAARELGFTQEECLIAWERLIRMEDDLDLLSEEGQDG